MLGRVLALTLLLGTPPALAAEDPPSGWRREAHLLTVGPGASWLDRFGHTLIAVGRVRPGRVESVVYDLAAPESGAPPTLSDLILGRARVHALRVGTVSRALGPHAAANRAVWTQRLALDERQVAELHAVLQAELDAPGRALSPIRESSTARARDLLDRVLGGTLRRRLAGQAPASARELHRRALAGDTLALLALDLFLGRRLDQPLDRFETAGLAPGLRDALAIGAPPLSDPPRPVLTRRGPDPGSASSTSPAELGALILTAALLLLGAAAWRRAPSEPRLAALFLLLGPVALGLLGGGQLLLMHLSELPEARLNELPLFFLPTDLTLLVLALAWLRHASPRRPALILCYAWTRIGLLALGLLGHGLGLLRQEPRVLLAPALVSAVGLLLLARKIEVSREDRGR